MRAILALAGGLAAFGGKARPTADSAP
jgi:hypothetical protein